MQDDVLVMVATDIEVRLGRHGHIDLVIATPMGGKCLALVFPVELHDGLSKPAAGPGVGPDAEGLKMAEPQTQRRRGEGRGKNSLFDPGRSLEIQGEFKRKEGSILI